MSTYLGMNRNTGSAVGDIAHIEQSIADILTTPIGSRLQRRDYGSLVFYLLDDPHNPATQLKTLSAIYSAVLKWENRVRLTAVTLDASEGKSSVKLTGNLVGGGAFSSLIMLTERTA